MHPADSIIMVLLLGISMGVGIFFARKQGMQNVEQYLMASRSAHPINVGLSIFVSFISGPLDIQIKHFRFLYDFLL